MLHITAVHLAFFINCLTLTLANYHRENLAYYIFNNEHYNEQLDSSNYLELIDVSLKFNIIIRGCGNGSIWADELVEVYLKEGKSNIILVDYSSDDGYNPSSVEEVQEIGYSIGESIIDIKDLFGVKLCDFHVIGYGIGAHIAAFAGQKVHEHCKLKIGRITALDAQLFLFVTVGEEARLSRGDAELVVAIHTDGGVNGFLEALGHVDFYPNGGVSQPGCEEPKNECSHARAPEYFVEAVRNPKGFISKRCASYVLYELGACNHEPELSIGGVLTRECEGTYYLKTNGEKPYSKE